MNTSLTFAPRPANRQVVIRSFLLSLVILLPFVLLMMAVTSCTPNETQQVVAAAGVVPTPSIGASSTIRTRVAAIVQSEVTAHPKIAPWANELAKACFQFSGATLPNPGTLQTGFAVAGYFVPSAYATDFKALATKVEAIYSADFPAASAVQAAGTPYLTLLGGGIQDGIKAAGVTEAP